jgi:hypothetical protein
MDDASERIAKAKGLARALGLPEQEVINAFLQEGLPNPGEQHSAQRSLGELQGLPENQMSPELALPTRSPFEMPLKDHPNWVSGPIPEGQFKRKNLQAEGVEQGIGNVQLPSFPLTNPQAR